MQKVLDRQRHKLGLAKARAEREKAVAQESFRERVALLRESSGMSKISIIVSGLLISVEVACSVSSVCSAQASARALSHPHLQAKRPTSCASC